MLSLKLSNLFPSSLVLFHTLIFPFERLRPPWLQWCQTSELHRPNPKISSTYRSFSYLERCFVMVMFIVQCSVPSNVFFLYEKCRGYSLILIFMSVLVSWSVVPVAYPFWLLSFTILSLDLFLLQPFANCCFYCSVWVARKPPGFAFIDFDDRRDAEDAIRDLDGMYLCVLVELALSGHSLISCKISWNCLKIYLISCTCSTCFQF